MQPDPEAEHANSPASGEDEEWLEPWAETYFGYMRAQGCPPILHF